MQGFQLSPTLKVDSQVHKLFKWFTAGPYPFIWPLNSTSVSVNFLSGLLQVHTPSLDS